MVSPTKLSDCYGRTSQNRQIALELELRFQANGKKCLEDASKAQIFGLPH